MKDITVIIPTVQETYSDYGLKLLDSAVTSARMAADLYKGGKVKLCIIHPSDIEIPEAGRYDDVRYIANSGATDYCSQINEAVRNVDTEYFSILEFDDQYMKKWFRMFDEYFTAHEDVSIFLPINIVKNLETGEMEFVNEIVWAASFSEEIGYVDFGCLENCSLFNLTGGIFKTSDWLGFKPSIKLAFNYEYLLRATNKKQKVFVVPKEGYHHDIFRNGSLSSEYMETIKDSDVQKWFELAKREYSFDEDRNKTIISDKVDELK